MTNETIKEINSYPKVWALGHKAFGDANILDGDVVVQEKIDGSQFSFMVDHDGVLHCRSKGKMLDMEDPEKMFIKAIEAVKEIKAQTWIEPGWIFRCEYLQKPKHNTLEYARTPASYLVGYDIQTGPSWYHHPLRVTEEFKNLGLETAPVYYIGRGSDLDMDGLRAYLEKGPLLGGRMIEGIVIKNYDLILRDGKVAMAKMVRKDFVEAHQNDWKKRNPTRSDIVEALAEDLATDARFQKSVQHMREDGTLTDSPRDIGPLIKAIKNDIYEEEKAAIAEALFVHFWPQISRQATKTVAPWYKQKLAAELLEN